MKVLPLMILLLSSSAVLAGETRIRVGLHSIPDYSEIVDGTCIGVFCDTVLEIFEDGLGLDVEFVMHPWQRIQLQVEKGEIDVMFAVPSERRLKYGAATKHPVFASKLRIYTYANHPKMALIRSIKSADEIKAAGLVSITNQGNGWHANRLESQGVKTIHVKDKDHIPRMLAAKRGDITIDETPMVRRLIENTGLEEKVVETDIVFETVYTHVVVSKRSKFLDLIPRIDRIILDSDLLTRYED